MKTVVQVLVASVCLMHAAVFAADAAMADKPTQQSKMKTCNADAKAKALKGDERKQFMSQCLKAK